MSSPLATHPHASALRKPLTPADLPPELFPYILAHVGRDSKYGGITPEGRRDLMNCSLVCIEWANRCREYLFGGKYAKMRHLEDLVLLDEYRATDSTHLKPIFSKLRGVRADLKWEFKLSPLPYCPIYGLSLELRQTLADNFPLAFTGPIPPHSNRVMCRYPPWAYCTPRTMPPSLLPFSSVVLHNIHFPRLSDLDAFLRHFTSAKSINLTQVTWTHRDMAAPLRPQCYRGMRWIAKTRADARECTDNAVACKLAFARVVSSHKSVFRFMNELELDACEALLEALASKNKSLELIQGLEIGARLIDEVFGIRWDRSLSVAVQSYHFDDFLEFHCEASLSLDKIPTSIRLVGIRLGIYQGGDSMSVGSFMRTLHSALPAFPHLRVVEFYRATAMEVLRATTERFPDLRQPPAPGGQYIYRWGADRGCFENLPSEYDYYDVISIDPATLQPNGHGWGRRSPSSRKNSRA